MKINNFSFPSKKRQLLANEQKHFFKDQKQKQKQKEFFYFFKILVQINTVKVFIKILI